MFALSTTSFLSFLLFTSRVHGFDIAFTPLTASQWKTQIGLDSEIHQTTWVYLTGRESCPDLQACETFDKLLSPNSRTHAAKSQRNQAFSLDCDVDPILCHSWLLTPPALMHFTISRSLSSSPLQIPVEHKNVIMRPIQLPLSNDTAAAQIASLLDTTDIDTLEVWNGFLNPFTGALGKYGGGLYWGHVKYYLNWLPASQQTLLIVGLMGVRLLMARYGTTKPVTSAADMVVPPGSIG
jgi:hypothetical protein